MTKLLAVLLSALLTALAGLGAGVLDALRREEVAGAASVVDGDTLRLDGAPIRLEGLDAPELRQLCSRDDGRPYACGEEARARLRELVADGPVACQVSGRDRYRRQLARCAAGGRDVGEALVREGLAVAYGRASPYADAERTAERERAGLWSGSFERPADWRRAQAPYRGEVGG